VRTPITVGVAGLDERGLELARTFDELPDADLRWLCDPRAEVRHGVGPRFSGANLVSDFNVLCEDEDLDAVVIVGPASSHYDRARRALEADKHVLVERPLALSGDDADALVRQAQRRRRRLMVTNDLAFQPALLRLKESIEHGTLGELYYVHGFHHKPSAPDETGVVWKLGTDHVSAILFLLADEPFEVSARGEPYLQAESEDVVFCSLKFATGISAHLHLSRLDPEPRWGLSLVGSRRSSSLDGSPPERPLTLCEHDAPLRRSMTEVEAHVGDIVIPSLPKENVVRRDCERVIALVRSSSEPRVDIRDAVAAVQVLEALQRSLERDGVPEPVGGSEEPTAARVIPLPGSFKAEARLQDA
jgi:predicted dehydrogenase